MSLPEYNPTRKRIQSYCKKQRYQRTRKMSTKELLDTLSRYDTKRKVYSNRRKILKTGLEKIAKIQNISGNELPKTENLQSK